MAFAASCCERLIPNYQAFVQKEKWGDYDLLRSALDKVWSFLAEEKIEKAQTLKIIETCEEIVPDTENFSSTFTSAALDAATAIIATLEACISPDLSNIVSVASTAIDTLDMYLQEKLDIDPSDPELDTKIYTNSLMVAEMEKQYQDLNFLKAKGKMTPLFLDELRQSNSNYGIQFSLDN